MSTVYTSPKILHFSVANTFFYFPVRANRRWWRLKRRTQWYGNQFTCPIPIKKKTSNRGIKSAGAIRPTLSPTQETASKITPDKQK